MTDIELPMGDPCDKCNGNGGHYSPMARMVLNCEYCDGTGYVDFEPIYLEDAKVIQEL